MTFRMNQPVSNELYEFLSVKHNGQWCPLTLAPTLNPSTLGLEGADPRTVLAQLQGLIEEFPTLVLNGTQDFRDLDGDHYRLVVVDNVATLLEGRIVFS